MKQETLNSHSCKQFKDLGITPELVSKAHSVDVYGSYSYNYIEWTTRRKFYHIILNLAAKKVSVEAAGTYKKILTFSFEDTEKALNKYIELVSMNQKEFFKKYITKTNLMLFIPIYYITDVIFKIILLPFLMIFQLKETKKIIQKETHGVKNFFKRILTKSWLNFDTFNEYKPLFFTVYSSFIAGAVLF